MLSNTVRDERANVLDLVNLIRSFRGDVAEILEALEYCSHSCPFDRNPPPVWDEVGRVLDVVSTTEAERQFL